MRRLSAGVLICAVLASLANGLIAVKISSASVSESLRPYVVVLHDHAGSSAGVAASHSRKYGARVDAVYAAALKGYSARLTATDLARLRADPQVAFVAADQPFSATERPPRGLDPPPQQLFTRDNRRIGAGLSSAVSGDGQGEVDVDIAILDTGIQPDHPDLNVVGGIACHPDNTGFDDLQGHGTHVAGTTAARDNQIGIVGVAPGARLWSVRVLGRGGTGTTATILCGIDWVTSTRLDANPTNDIDVANMSLGGRAHVADDGDCGRRLRDALHLGICNSTEAGVSYVVSAGNDAIDVAQYKPAGYPEVIAATAMTDTDGQPGGLGQPEACLGSADDTVAEFSNFATSTADQRRLLAAPGVCISSTWLLSRYINMSGTSMAAPHIAGTVALCVAYGECAGLSPAQVIQKIVGDAAAFNQGNPSYGFQGDPSRPLAGKYYGYLVRASLY